jgi:hypothetical protein
VASPTSETTDLGAIERLAAMLLTVMALLALTSVAAGVGAMLLGRSRFSPRLFGWGRDLVVLAPLVSLIGVALRAFRYQRRLGLLALGALLVTLVGLGLAR